MAGLFSGGAGSQAVSSDQWTNLQDQMANYQYDPNDPDKWQRLVNAASQYQDQTQNTGSAVSGLDKVSNALSTLGGGGGLGSGKQQQAQVAPPRNALGGYAQMPSAQYHPGSAASGLSNDLSNLAALIKTKGLLGL